MKIPLSRCQFGEWRDKAVNSEATRQKGGGGEEEEGSVAFAARTGGPWIAQEKRVSLDRKRPRRRGWEWVGGVNSIE